MKDKDKAKEYIALSQAFLHQDSVSLFASNQMIYGAVLLDLGEFSLAEEVLRRGLIKAKKVNDNDNLISFYLRLGQIHNRQGQPDSTLFYSNKALEIIAISGIEHRIFEAYHQKSMAYAKMGDFKNAFHTHAKHLDYRDEIDERKSQYKLRELSAEYQAKVVEKENQLLKERNRADKLIIYIISIVLAVVMASAVFLSFMRKRERNRSTQLQKLNNTVNDQNAKLQKLLKERERLLSIVGHDMKTPISSLNSLLDMALSKDLDQDEQQHWFGQVHLQLKQTSDLLENVLGWAKTQLDGYISQKQVFNLKQLLEVVVEIYAQVLQKKELDLELRCPDENIKADRDIMHLVLRNLISNAVKFTQKGGRITLKARLMGNLARIEVCDNGVGITDEVKQRLFTSEGSQRLGTEKEVGTGLGLAMCKEFVLSSGGEIGVQPNEPKGSCFWVTFPIGKR